GRFHPFVFPVAQASDLSGLNAASQKFPYIFIFLLPFPEETPGVVEIPAIDLTGATEVCPDVKSVPHFLGGSDMGEFPAAGLGHLFQGLPAVLVQIKPDDVDHGFD